MPTTKSPSTPLAELVHLSSANDPGRRSLSRLASAQHGTGGAGPVLLGRIAVDCQAGQSIVNSCVCGFRWPRLRAPATALSLRSQMNIPRALGDPRVLLRRKHSGRAYERDRHVRERDSSPGRGWQQPRPGALGCRRRPCLELQHERRAPRSPFRAVATERGGANRTRRPNVPIWRRRSRSKCREDQPCPALRRRQSPSLRSLYYL
jgi:hypothetical protein